MCTCGMIGQNILQYKTSKVGRDNCKLLMLLNILKIS